MSDGSKTTYSKAASVIAPFFKLMEANENCAVAFKHPCSTEHVAIPILRQESEKVTGFWHQDSTLPGSAIPNLHQEAITSLLYLKEYLEGHKTGQRVQSVNGCHVSSSGPYDPVLCHTNIFTDTVEGQEAFLISEVFSVMDKIGNESGFNDVYRSSKFDRPEEKRVRVLAVLCDIEIAAALNAFSKSSAFIGTHDPRMKGRILIGLNSALCSSETETTTVLSFGYLGYQKIRQVIESNDLVKFTLAHRFMINIPALGVIDVLPK